MSPNDHIIFDGCHTGNTYLSSKQAVFTNNGIMANMNLVVEFCSFSNNCVACYTFINGTARANFNIIGNHNTTTTFHFVVSFGTAFKVKGIGSNDGSSMNHNSVHGLRSDLPDGAGAHGPFVA